MCRMFRIPSGNLCLWVIFVASHIVPHSAELSVALVFAGPFRGKTSTSAEINRAILKPLVAGGIRVSAFVAGFRADRELWESWWGDPAGVNNSVPFVWRDLVDSPDGLGLTRPLSSSHFSNCAYPPHRDRYHGQYNHLEQAWRMVQDEVSAGKSWTFGVKIRNDLLYDPGQTVKPCWLKELPENVTITNDSEFHAPYRWNEMGFGKGAHTCACIFIAKLS